MAPPSLGNQSMVEIFVSALGNATTFQCRVDNGEPTCSSPFSASLSDGAHTFDDREAGRRASQRERAC